VKKPVGRQCHSMPLRRHLRQWWGGPQGGHLVEFCKRLTKTFYFFYSVPSTTYTFSPRIRELSHATFEL
jgi:hypothetical protein